jgi:hypothetical protein
MYTTVSDVQSTIPYVPITRESKPSEGVVQQWIIETESTLNTALAGLGYRIPLVAQAGKTTEAAITILRTAVRHAVAAMVLRARPNPESDPALLQARYDSILKMLRDPQDPFALPDVEETQQEVLKTSPLRVLSNLSDDLQETARISRKTLF